ALSTLAYNLQQREIILPSEKAFAYKYKFEAMKSKGKRNDLTSSHVATKLHRDKLLAQKNNESKHTMYRFIRLTNLIQELLEKVDERKISFIPAVEISYLSTEEQKNLLEILLREERFNIPLKQASMLKAISQKGNLTYAKIDKIITDKIKQQPEKVKISYKKIKDYFPANITPKQLEISIVEALDLWAKYKKERA
ncbi:MAG: chromosome partitioning protein ParB, partial [Clostridiales bacterium]|nr:chromosome partitioning protein ParB [Clostridiales bacterium]